MSRLSQKQINKLYFPLGKYTKPQVRALAKEYDLPNAERADSQGICFLGNLKYNDFVAAYLGAKPGNIVDHDTNKVLGSHNGFWFHTIGQRKGLGLSGGPWFVSGKNKDENIVFVRHVSFKQKIHRKSFVIDSPNWFSDPKCADEIEVKIRHGENQIPCKLQEMSAGQYSVVMEQSDAGLAAGQFAVFYQNGSCLGSGVVQ